MNKYIPSIGDKLTINNMILSEGGYLMFEKGNKVTVSEIRIRKGHWHSKISDLWIEDKLDLIKIEEDGDSLYSPNTFKETKEDKL